MLDRRCLGTRVRILRAVVSAVAAWALPQSAVAVGDEASAPAAAAIELRKSFSSTPRSGRHSARVGGRAGRAADALPNSAGAGNQEPPPAGIAAMVLGETLQSSGTLHLPGVAPGGLELRGSTTPVVRTEASRQIIVDSDNAVTPAEAAAIERLWPDFTVLRLSRGTPLLETVEALLDASGYHSVLRSVPLTFGSGVTVRIVPDFIVLREERDLLDGETRAISVVDPGQAIPAELQELAGEHRIKVVDVRSDGTPAIPAHTIPRDPTGKVTTMETRRLAPLVEEIAAAIGVKSGRLASLPGGDAAIAARTLLTVSAPGAEVLVVEQPAPGSESLLSARAPAPIVLRSAADLTEAIGILLGRLGIPAIGPVVELHPATQNNAPRFAIRVPGWLARIGDRQLLITGAAPQLQIRLYLTREGIDIFEYRIRQPDTGSPAEKVTQAGGPQP